MIWTYVDVEAAEVLTEFLLLLGTNVLEVLVAEDYNAALGYQQCELILLGVRQLGELQAGDLGADTRCQLGGLQVRILLGQKVWLCRVRIKTAVLEVEQFGGQKLGGRVIDGEVRRIFGLSIRLE